MAINFDRQRQGLMNGATDHLYSTLQTSERVMRVMRVEYKWSHEYSRSVGVDVRYILWLVGTHDGAQHLVDEMVA